LVRRAHEGEEQAFEEIVRLYSPRVFHIVSRFFRNRNTVEELAQEIFLKVYTQLGNYEGRGSFEGWLSKIATNICLNALRSVKRRPESSITDLTEAEMKWMEQSLGNIAIELHQSAESKIVAADLAEKLLQTLSPDDRLILILFEGDELSIKEVAEMTGWSESKIKTQLFRARGRMRKALEDLLPGNRLIKRT
jgi:RNA polymerase sigma factor (sigma-70 family)